MACQQQVGHTAGLTGFMNGADADGDVGRNDRRIVPFDHQQFQPVGKLVLNDFLFEGAAAKRRAGEAGQEQAQQQNDQTMHKSHCNSSYPDLYQACELKSIHPLLADGR